MPNGEIKNWVRLCSTINGFRSKYKCWPNRIRLYKQIHEDLFYIFSPQSFTKLEEKVKFIIDDSPIIVAEDDEGRSYSYGEEDSVKIIPDIDAREWLGIEPDN